MTFLWTQGVKELKFFELLCESVKKVIGPMESYQKISLRITRN